PEQFPAAPQVDRSTAFAVPAGRFLEMIRRTSFAAAREETRYAINGLLLDVDQGCVRLVGTDGRRLALAYVNVDQELPPRTRAIVPIRTLQALTKAVHEDADEPLSIALGKNQIHFAIDGIELTSQLLDNRFPEYEQVIPKAADSTVELSRELLEKNLRRVAVLSSGDLRMV